MSTRDHVLKGGPRSTVFVDHELRLAMNAFSNKTADTFVSDEGSIRGDHGEHELMAGRHDVRHFSKSFAMRVV